VIWIAVLAALTVAVAWRKQRRKIRVEAQRDRDYFRRNY
jgi:hypothetical protein